MTPLAAAKGLALAADVPEGLVLQSDRRRVKQVLMNLLSNAIKFSDQGGVRVAVEALGEELAVRVTDRGIGIRPEDLDKLFNPFSQIDMSSTKQYEGTGLGLYLCKKILTLLRGTISVRSEYGRGSTFTFILPLRMEGDSGMKKVLIIEDNENNLYMMRFIVTKLGHQVLEARDGAAGVELAKKNRPDLILMDIQLPVLDGYAATRLIREDRRSQGRPHHRRDVLSPWSGTGKRPSTPAARPMSKSRSIPPPSSRSWSDYLSS